MDRKQWYIITGCNGAGKTTASFTILPEILQCYQFVNADEMSMNYLYGTQTLMNIFMRIPSDH